MQTFSDSICLTIMAIIILHKYRSMGTMLLKIAKSKSLHICGPYQTKRLKQIKAFSVSARLIFWAGKCIVVVPILYAKDV